MAQQVHNPAGNGIARPPWLAYWPVLAFLGGQLAGGIWWASQADSRLDSHDTAIARVERDVDMLDAATDDLDDRLAVTLARLDVVSVKLEQISKDLQANNALLRSRQVLR